VTIASVEAELMRQVQAEKRRWHEIAALLMRVEREALWRPESSSFSAWLQGMARRADLQESVFWRCLKAGRIYLELTGKEELAGEIAASAESLELADKIRRHAPRAIGDEVLGRTLDGELGRTELRQVWATYRGSAGDSTARGRLPDDPEERAAALELRHTAWEAQKRSPEARAELRRCELVSAFRAADWLGGFDQVRSETRLQGLDGRLSALLVVRRKAQQPERLEVHGLWTVVARPELVDFEFKAPLAVDYMWLALPSELSERALAVVPRMLGVLELTRQRTLQSVREAQRRASQAEGKLALLTHLLQRAYLWP